MNKRLNLYFSDKKIIDILLILLVFGACIRLAAGMGYYNEQDTTWYRTWALSLPDGLFNVYARADAISLDYPPVYLFFLYITGLFYKLAGADCQPYIQMFLMKMWPILGDLLCALALYVCCCRFGKKAGLLAAGLWLFNPSVLFNSAFWGQTDQIMCLLLLVSFVLLERERPVLACLMFAIAGLTKFQCLFFVPVFLMELFMRYRIKAFLQGVGTAALTVAAVFLPFMLGASNPFLFFDVYLAGQGKYPHCTLNAFNLYGLFGLNWVQDTEVYLLGLPVHIISLFITIILVIGVMALYVFARRRSIWVISFWFMNSLFMLTTRMHERYQFVVLIFLLFACVAHKSRGLLYSFLAVSVMTFLNQMIPMFSWNGANSFFHSYYNTFLVGGSLLNMLLYIATTAVCLRFLFKTCPVEDYHKQTLKMGDAE